MKNAHLEEYIEFFLKLPSSDYLTDIEIQDEYEQASDLSSHGLSAEQVSQIAIDSLKGTDSTYGSESTNTTTPDPPPSPPSP